MIVDHRTYNVKTGKLNSARWRTRSCGRCLISNRRKWRAGA